MLNITNISEKELHVESSEMNQILEPGESVILWNNASSLNGISPFEAAEEGLVDVHDVEHDTKQMWQPVKAIANDIEEDTCLDYRFFLRKCREMRRKIVDEDVNMNYSGPFIPQLHDLEGVISARNLKEAKNAFRNVLRKMKDVYQQEKQQQGVVNW